MIDSTIASKQIQRLAGLDFYPKNDAPALKELRLAAEAAQTPQILAAVVDEWLAEHPECPKPVHLRKLIWSRQSKPEPDPQCPGCNGSGVVIRWVLSWNAEEGSDVVRKRRYVESEAAGWRQVAQLPGSAMASVCDAAVPCRCRKAA